jgi:hypothetical protein
MNHEPDIIPPEIIDDEFAERIEQICSLPEVITCIEIGSSDGRGSTQSILRGIRGKQFAALYAFEVNKDRFAALLELKRQHPELIPCNYSTVSLDSFMSPADVRKFCETHSTNTNRIPIDEVLSWIELGKGYIREHGLICNGLPEIVAGIRGADNIDFVLIDGSPFTAKAELAAVFGARYIALDDANDVKNYETRKYLGQSKAYSLVYENLYLRNGYAIFKRNA